MHVSNEIRPFPIKLLFGPGCGRLKVTAIQLVLFLPQSKFASVQLQVDNYPLCTSRCCNWQVLAFCKEQSWTGKLQSLSRSFALHR